METIQEKDLSFDSSNSDRNECEISYQSVNGICNSLCQLSVFIGSVVCQECQYHIQQDYVNKTVICLLANNH
jgi:hypothetical protein